MRLSDSENYEFIDLRQKENLKIYSNTELGVYVIKQDFFRVVRDYTPVIATKKY